MPVPFYIDEQTGEIVLLDENGQPMPGFLPQMGTGPQPWNPTDYSAGYDYATPPGREQQSASPPGAFPDDITPQGGWGAPIKTPSNRLKRAQMAVVDAQRRYDAAQRSEYPSETSIARAWDDLQSATKELTAAEQAESALPPPPRAPTGLPNSPYLVDAQGNIVPNKYYIPPAGAAPRQPTALGANTSAPFITMMMPDGTIQTIPNPNFLPEGENDLERQRFEWTRDYQQRSLEQQQQEAAWRRQQQDAQNRISMFQHLQDTQRQLLPRMVPPGQEYWAGFEPQSAMQGLFNMVGLPWQQQSYKVNTVPWDPNAAWQQAQALLASGEQPGG